MGMRRKPGGAVDAVAPHVKVESPRADDSAGDASRVHSDPHGDVDALRGHLGAHGELHREAHPEDPMRVVVAGL